MEDTMRTVCLLAATLSLAACGPKSGRAHSTPAPNEMMEASTRRMVYMHVMLDRADAARTWITRGDLAEARARAKEFPTASAPPRVTDAWSVYVADAYKQAATIQSAERLDVAAIAVARLGASCGACHAESGVSAQVREVVMASDQTAADPRMDRHQKAADWMWAGLVSSDVDVYDLGASLFLSDALPPLPEAVRDEPALTALATRVNALAVQARAAGSMEARAERYAEILTTCAVCHLSANPPMP